MTHLTTLPLILLGMMVLDEWFPMFEEPWLIGNYSTLIITCDSNSSAISLYHGEKKSLLLRWWAF